MDGSRCPLDGSPGSQGLQQGTAGTQDSGWQGKLETLPARCPKSARPSRLRAAHTLRAFPPAVSPQGQFPMGSEGPGPPGSLLSLCSRGSSGPAPSCADASCSAHHLRGQHRDSWALEDWKFMDRWGSMVGSLLPPLAIQPHTRLCRPPSSTARFCAAPARSRPRVNPSGAVKD